MLNPDLPTTKTYVKHLNEIEFPLVFRICAYEFDRSNVRFQNYGYSYDFDYFIGQSMYNNSLFGWNGHTKNGSTIGSFEGYNLYNAM